MGLAIFKPWNWVLVAAVVVCSGPLAVAAVCTSLFSAFVLFLVAGAILVHAFFTSAYQVFTSFPLSASHHPHNGHHPAPPSASGLPPLLVMQGGSGASSRSRVSRGSFSQRSGSALSSSSSSPASSNGSNSGSLGSAGGISSMRSACNGNAAGGFGAFAGFSGFGLGSVGGSLSSSSSSSTGIGNGRRHSLIPTLGDGLDGYYGDEDYDLDDPYRYGPDEDDWASDFAAQSNLLSHRQLYHSNGDTTPRMRRDSQNGGSQPSASLSFLLNSINQRSGGQVSTTPTSRVPMPIASNSSRRRASSIGGLPSLVRSGSRSMRSSYSGSSTPWRQPRQPSDIGL